jgi:hypothetical protein
VAGAGQEKPRGPLLSETIIGGIMIVRSIGPRLQLLPSTRGKEELEEDDIEEEEEEEKLEEKEEDGE